MEMVGVVGTERLTDGTEVADTPLPPAIVRLVERADSDDFVASRLIGSRRDVNELGPTSGICFTRRSEVRVNSSVCRITIYYKIRTRKQSGNVDTLIEVLFLLGSKRRIAHKGLGRLETDTEDGDILLADEGNATLHIILTNPSSVHAPDDGVFLAFSHGAKHHVRTTQRRRI